MDENAAGTSGGRGGTSGERRRKLALLALVFVGFVAIQSFANVESSRADLARSGVTESLAHVWLWELSSVAMWVLLLPAIGWMVARVRPPRLDWRWALLAHAAATVPLSAIHVSGMIAIRIAVYALWGQRYDYGGVLDRFVYEYRKDVTAYLMLAAFMGFAQWWLARREAVPAAAAESDVLLVADGSVTHHVPADRIESASAAGNYVEIVWSGRTLLHRTTLAALAERLGPGFVRIHRGRIVRRAAVRSIETDKSGDFTVTLESGATLRGSRRYRGRLG
ncbi:MAG: LytTR family transcriptional regulator [Sphingomonas sp.]|uniref:LytR/AlgR family response regulator transcription factor n=1 Tax=Sphingomonas sp. TaxID=28214 RepID=UPI001B08A37E|nr:LytTR family DNA-binding domain-containing protein [Sphingomonas sp.]MBO9621467.1 LytTR family transcriptional regulator [Sphingomonas sp.]